MSQVSFWERESFFAPQDIIIVGSGFAGLWSALKLKALYPAHKITILERGIIPTGASTRNAGFSCFGSAGELLNDAMLMGEDKLWRLVEMRYKGLLEIQKYFSADIIDYDPVGGYECFTHDSEDWIKCNEKLDWLNTELKKITGKNQVFTVSDEKIVSFGFKGFDHLIENNSEGGLHPGKLVQALLSKVQGMGVQVLTGAEVRSFETDHKGIHVRTADLPTGKAGFTFQTNQLLLCTNAFTADLVPGIDIIPNRGQVLITNPVAGLKIKGTFHFNKGYYYFRNVGDRLLLGGGRNKAFETENTDVMQTTELIQTELEQFIQQYLLPRTPFHITDRWSGIMAMGSEKLPIVKAISKNVFCCVRMSGMGVALAPIVAEEVAGLMKQ